jgi:hypothetical protein
MGSGLSRSPMLVAIKAMSTNARSGIHVPARGKDVFLCVNKKNNNRSNNAMGYKDKGRTYVLSPRKGK